MRLAGALALFAGLLMPLTDAGQALANPALAQRQAQARELQGEGFPATPGQVVAVGDFQNQLGCGDFDVACGVTQLQSIDGIWSGVFPITPGSYQVQFIAIAEDGQQFTYGDDGLDSAPLTLEVGDNETGAFFSFNAHTNETRAEAVDALYTLETDDGTLPLAPDEDGDNLTALVPSEGGDLDVQLQVNGELAGDPQVVSLESGPNRITVAKDGSILDTEGLPSGTLTITRTDSDGQPVPGACYQVRNGGEVVNQGCDSDDGTADGSTILTFPEGLESGDYTLVEAQPPEGTDAADDQQISLQPGDNTFQVQAGDAAGGDPEAEGETPEATEEEGGIIGTTEEAGEEADQTPEATQAQEEGTGEPGDLIVTLQDGDGNPVGGACFQLLRGDEVVAEACDTNDAFPDNGNSGFFGVPSGTYTLRQSTTPEGSTTVDDREVTIRAGQEVTETIEAAPGPSDETPTATATAAASGDVVVLRQDAEGNPAGGACFEIVGADGTVIGQQACDEDGDVPDDGRTGFFDIPAGAVTLRETRTPDGVEPAAEQPFEVRGDAVTEVTVRSAVIATEEPTPEPTEEATAEPTAEATPPPETPEGETQGAPGDLIVTLQDDAGAPIGGACFELLQDDQVITTSCDTDDAFPDNGRTGFFGVPSGTYTLRQSQVPEGSAAIAEIEVTVAAGQEANETVEPAGDAASPTEQVEPTATAAGAATEAAEGDDATGATAVRVDVSSVDAAGGAVCVELNTSGGIGLAEAPAACDNGEGDADPAEGTILIEDVPAGEFAIFVTEGPAEVTATTQDPPPVQVTEGETVDVTIEPGVPAQPTVAPEPTAQPTEPPEPTAVPGAVQVSVQDADGAAITEPGTCIRVNRVSGTVCDNEDGDVNGDPGVVRIDAIPAGTYTVSQSEAPEGYDVGEEIEDVAVEAGAVTDVPLVLAASAPETGAIAITVIDGEDAAVGGACFDVTNDSGTFPFCDEDGDGQIDVPDVTFGSQTVTQTEAGDGYAVDPEPQTVDVTAEDPTAELTFRNDVDAGILPVVAVDADRNPLPGACWTLSGDGGEFGPLCDDGANGGTAEDGQVQFESAPSGTYTLAQTQPPAGYGAVAEQEITVAAGTNEPVEVTHEIAPITVQVTTTDAEGGILAGACYAVDGGEPLCDSDGDAIVNLENVAPGERTISQTTAPEGFAAAADQTLTVEIGQAPEVTFVNDAPLVGSVSVALVDEAGEPIIGACVAVGDAAICDNAPEDLDDADGALLTEELDPGEYVVTVTDLPEGYDIPDPQTVTVTADETTAVEFSVVATAPETGNLNVAVRTEGGDAVAGTCVVLTRDGTAVAGPVCDNAEGDGDPAEGTVAVAEIETGTYTVGLTSESTAAIDGFQSAGSPSVEIMAGETADVVIAIVISVEPQTGTLQIVTRDNATNRRVNEACYQLTGNGDPIVACDGGSLDQNGTAGILQLADVPGGDYTVTMDAVPNGYGVAPEEGLTVEAGVVNGVEVRIDPLPQAGALVVSKVDGGGEPLGDSCFAVQRGGSTVASVCDAVDASPNDGIIEFADLAAGSYRLVETQVPSTAYAAADPVAFEIVAGETTELTVTNTPNPGRLVVTKVDAADASSRLPNACFILQGDREYGPFCDADDRAEDGRTVFANIVPGDYQLVETVPPAGYVVADPRDVTIEPGSSQRVTVANEVAPLPEEAGTLVVSKQDAARDPLPGGCFRLFDGETTVTGRVCDNTDGTDDGTITFNDVPAGTWILHETLPPSPSYQIADDREVTITNGETTEVSVVNTLKPGRVLVNKTNPEGQPLQDACFDLGSDGSDARCTDAAGVVVFSDVGPGSYVLTETSAPTGYDTGEPVRDIAVQPGETAVLNLVNERTPPPANTGSVQIQKFYCPAGEAGERTQFLGGADGATQLSKTAGCDKGNAVFTLVAEEGSGGPGEFSTGDDGQYQVTVPEGLYTLTETDPDLAGNSSVRVRVFTGQLTTVIVLNDLAPPEPEPATINVAKYTCTPSFNGTLYADFAQNCSSTELLTNDITIRAEGPVTALAVTGDGGKRGETSFTDLQPGRYTIYEERPYSIPTDYVFCGFDGDVPADYKAVNGRLEIEIDYGQTLTCRFFNIPEDLTETTGTILVRKYVCEVTDPPKGYDWENECRLSDQGSSFELSPYDPETEEYGDVTTGQANPDGLLRFTRLEPGEYRLREAETTWCHAESNSVNSRGDVVVRANTLAEVWIYNCVDTDAPPNTGSGDAAGWVSPPGGNGAGGGMTVLLSIAWPALAAAGWRCVIAAASRNRPWSGGRPERRQHQQR